MAMKKLSTEINSETMRKLEKAASARGMTASDAMEYIAKNGVASFLSINGRKAPAWCQHSFFWS